MCGIPANPNSRAVPFVPYIVAVLSFAQPAICVDQLPPCRGFAGMRDWRGRYTFDPRLPEGWERELEHKAEQWQTALR